MSTKQPSLPRAFLRVSTIAAMLDTSKGQIWNMAKIGTFPAPIKISQRITVWDATEVEAWVRSHKPNLAINTL